MFKAMALDEGLKRWWLNWNSKSCMGYHPIHPWQGGVRLLVALQLAWVCRQIMQHGKVSIGYSFSGGSLDQLFLMI